MFKRLACAFCLVGALDLKSNLDSCIATDDTGAALPRILYFGLSPITRQPSRWLLPLWLGPAGGCGLPCVTLSTNTSTPAILRQFSPVITCDMLRLTGCVGMSLEAVKCRRFRCVKFVLGPWILWPTELATRTAVYCTFCSPICVAFFTGSVPLLFWCRRLWLLQQSCGIPAPKWQK